MEDVTTLLLQQVVVPVLSSVLIALGGWVLTKLPGPLRDALQANVHEKDVRRLVEAASRRATAILTGHVTTAMPVDDVIAYVRQTYPQVVAKLNPSDEALKTIAASAIAAVRQEVRAFDAIQAVSRPEVKVVEAYQGAGGAK